MADISKIVPLNGTEYNIKDATARSGLAGKVSTAQGTANAGKILKVNSSGNLALSTIFPAGGAAGALLGKKSATNDDVEWVAVATTAEENDMRPITSGAVYTILGNIEALLATI